MKTSHVHPHLGPPNPITNENDTTQERQTPRTSAVMRKGSGTYQEMFEHACDLERELAQARAECERLRRDRERMDNLEKFQSDSSNGYIIINPHGVSCGEPPVYPTLRDYIDAQMEPKA